MDSSTYTSVPSDESGDDEFKKPKHTLAPDVKRVLNPANGVFMRIRKKEGAPSKAKAGVLIAISQILKEKNESSGNLSQLTDGKDIAKLSLAVSELRLTSEQRRFSRSEEECQGCEDHLNMTSAPCVPVNQRTPAPPRKSSGKTPLGYRTPEFVKIKEEESDYHRKERSRVRHKMVCVKTSSNQPGIRRSTSCPPGP